MKNILIIKQIDKANHIIVGMLIYCIFAAFIHPVFALLIVCMFSAAKEFWDMYRHRMIFDWYDFIATIAGAVPSFIISIL